DAADVAHARHIRQREDAVEELARHPRRPLDQLLAMMDIFEREQLIERAAQMSSYFLDGVFSLSDLPGVCDIRGIGMMAAIELDADPKAPGARGHDAQKALYDAGLNLKSTGDSLILAPPFVAERAHIDEIVGKLRQTLAAR
ncbi:MAG TPA: aminotransferase class III-fold pyridoxal phosphate-dependent enzyme, partial [Burkholderiaceae bacterium]|nr:aminotransferase class III-fold pyridoxal phosphate-dependent enzyme [Burkholderiaceae bacterium]